MTWNANYIYLVNIRYLVLGLNTRIPIQTFKKALEFEGMNVEIEEAEWMLANMIYKVNIFEGCCSIISS